MPISKTKMKNAAIMAKSPALPKIPKAGANAMIGTGQRTTCDQLARLNAAPGPDNLETRLKVLTPGIADTP